MKKRRMSILPAGMDSRLYNGTGKDGVGGSVQTWQRNATETLARTQTTPAQRANTNHKITSPRMVTPEPGDHDFSFGGSSARSEENGHSPTQTSPRSIPGGVKPRDRRQGLIFEDSYSAEALEQRVVTGPPVSLHSRPRTRTTSGAVEEHKRTRSTSTTSVSKSRHRIGSVHSSNSSSLHGVDPRPPPDPATLGFSTSGTGSRSAPLQKSNSVKSVKSGRRLVKRTSRPTSPLSAMSDAPSVDSLPFPIATGDANKILMLMKTLCGRMRGEVEYQTYESGTWYSGICYIDDAKGTLMYEGEDNGPFHLTVISDLRGCCIRPIVSADRKARCLEISNKSQGLELHLMPTAKAEYDLWLAALLCWQQVRTGTLPAAPTRPAQPVDRMPETSKRNSLHSYPLSPLSGQAREGNIIKVAKCLLWDKGSPTSPRAIVRRPSTRDLKSQIRVWRRVSCILQDNGEFKLLTESDSTLLSVIQLSQLSRCAIQRLDKSVLDQEYCIAIYPRYTSSSNQLSIFRPVYIALESRLLFEVWFCLLIAFSVPDIYGPERSNNSNGFISSSLRSTEDMFRIEKSLKLRIVEAKIRRSVSRTDIIHTGKQTTKDQDHSVGQYFAEVLLDGEVRARTLTRNETRNPFWREDYEFQDLPATSPRLTIVLKRVGNPVQQQYGFLSSSLHGPNQANEILCGTVDIPAEKLERGKDNEVWWPMLDPLQEPIGEIFLKIRYDELVVLLAKDYEPISTILHNFGTGLTDQIAQIMATNLRGLSEILMNIFQVSGHASDWLMALVEDEIDGVGKDSPVRRLRWSKRMGSNESFNSTGEREQTVRDIGKTLQGEANLLFRGSSLFTQAMDFHMRRLGKEYLEEVLAEKILHINNINADCEVDPSRLGTGDDANKNWSLLIALTTDIWSNIASSASRCPVELRQALKYIRAVAEDRYGDFFRTVTYTSVSGFLFLRFLCPALLNPKLFGLLRDHPQPKAQRTLTLIAKSLQALANLSTFGQKEEWMEPMNRFLTGHRQEVKAYIDEVCSVSGERNKFALPASYSTPITILARLPPASREGFPSLPYLIDHARNFAALVKLWLDTASPRMLPGALEGDLAEFHQQCLNLQRRANECLLRAENSASPDQISPWDDLVDRLEEAGLDDDAGLTRYPHSDQDSDDEPLQSPPWAEFTTTISAGRPPGSSGSEPNGKEREKDRRDRQSFWDSTFGRDRNKSYDPNMDNNTQVSPPTRVRSSNGNGNKPTRSFLSGLRRKTTKETTIRDPDTIIKNSNKTQRSTSLAEGMDHPVKVGSPWGIGGMI
ncbi:hypothetical protein HYFRA_00006021 [Hymenoscyphus fraxineus]|uniref:Ras-GAP domain-containing protein n=1 Tax=Hymenoscyphus fraxineus TaxID=746836 RepID=A0A9N9PIG3_9HELO|nr:hypothetical protein HYFRA_00006021 [Hymenoscyphus fraxineus]